MVVAPTFHGAVSRRPTKVTLTDFRTDAASLEAAFRTNWNTGSERKSEICWNWSRLHVLKPPNTYTVVPKISNHYLLHYKLLKLGDSKDSIVQLWPSVCHTTSPSNPTLRDRERYQLTVQWLFCVSLSLSELIVVLKYERKLIILAILK